MLRRRSLCFAFVLALPVVAGEGCKSRSSRHKVVDQWTQRLDVMGLVPIIPPREDIRVGDIHVYDVDPHSVLSLEDRRNAARLIAATSRWGAVPVLDELQAEYTDRPSWPSTPDAFIRSGAGQTTWDEPATDDARSIFATDAVPVRLRNVNLESLTSISFTASDMESVVPTEIGPLVRGVADSEQIALNFRVGAAESYAIAMDALLSLLTEAGADGTGFRIRQPFRNNLAFRANAEGRVFMAIVTEVVYFRSVDITVRPVDADPGDDEVSTHQLTPGPVVEVSSVLDPVYASFLRAKAINDVMAEGEVDDAPGSSMRFISVTDEAVAMRKVWPRGLAIGFRGLSLELDAATGDVVESQPLMWPVALSTQLSR